jgi:hypothetical protein
MDDPYMITNVERAFYQMAKKGTNQRELEEYFFTHYSQKLVLLNHVYSHIESHLPGYTDHGPEHVERILCIFEKMLKNNVWYLDHERDYDDNPLKVAEALNIYELYALLCATLWHDAGNIFGRKEHEQQLKKIQERLDLFFVDDDIMNHVLAIAKSHSGRDSITINIESDENYRGEPLNLQFLAGILRLADELEEGESRVDRTYYQRDFAKVPADQKIFWEISLCIKRIEPKPNEQTIDINAKLANEAACFTLYPKKIGDNTQNIAFIDELIFRINKMNEERRYYMRFAAKYLSFKQIEFKLKIDRSTFIFVFDDTHGAKEFWETLPNLNPEGHVPQYKFAEQQT